MARTNNLTNFLTDVANAIKTKTGDSTAIPASQFDTKIAGISTGNLTNEEYAEANTDLDNILENAELPEGTITITENGEYDVTNYTDANVNVVSDFNVKSGARDINNYASFTAKITEIISYDVVNSTILVECFMNLHGLTKAPTLLNYGSVTTIEKFFYGCESLVDVPIYDFPNVTNITNAFRSCPSLSDESLNNILAMCIGMTKVSSNNKSLYKLGLSSAQATICQSLSNYQAFLNAGWTTGY